MKVSLSPETFVWVRVCVPKGERSPVQIPHTSGE